jgi:hypothetical protein
MPCTNLDFGPKPLCKIVPRNTLAERLLKLKKEPLAINLLHPDACSTSLITLDFDEYLIQDHHLNFL